MDIANFIMGGRGNNDRGGRGGTGGRTTARSETRNNNTYEQHQYSAPVERDGYRVLAVMLMETGTYNPEFLRPYTVSVDRNDIQTIADIAEQNVGTMLNPALVGGVAGRVLRYSSEVSRHDLVDIENGWDTRRLSFLIEVVEDSRPDYEYGPSNKEVVTYISGWTDRMDFATTARGDVAPPDDLSFYVANVHRIERETRRIHTNHQLIVPSYHGTGYGGNNRGDLYTVRPKDVFNDEMSRERTPADANRLNTANRLHGTMPRTSRSSNLLPSTYIASSVNALIRGETQRNTHNDGYGNYDTNRGHGGRANVYATASSLLTEQTAFERNSFMYLLRQQSTAFSAYTKFSWGDLTDIFSQDILRVTSLYKRKSVERRGDTRSRWARAGDTAGWDCNENGGYNAVFATALKQSLPAYALESMIYSCRIEATNIVSATERFNAINGVLITVSDVVFIARMPNSQEEHYLIDQMKTNIASNILRDVSLDNDIDYDVVVDLDWRNDSFFSVAIDGGRMVEFSSSSFSNSLTPPIITTNPHFTENIAADLKAVVNEILDRKNGR